MSDLYDSDVVAWSAQQAGLLRRVAAGEAVKQPLPVIDQIVFSEDQVLGDWLP